MDLTKIRMNIAAPCALAFALVGASIYTMLTCKDCQPFLDYQKTLSPKLKLLYKHVLDERTRLYIHGTILGLVLAFATTYVIYNNLSPFANGCLFTVIVLGTQYLYYNLMPKSLHMLPNLETKEQVDQWHNVYHHMKSRYLIGFVLGMVGFFMLSYFTRK